MPVGSFDFIYDSQGKKSIGWGVRALVLDSGRLASICMGPSCRSQLRQNYTAGAHTLPLTSAALLLALLVLHSLQCTMFL